MRFERDAHNAAPLHLLEGARAERAGEDRTDRAGSAPFARVSSPVLPRPRSREAAPSNKWRGKLKVTIAAGLSLFLAACGFRPLYGSYGANPGASQIFSSIYVEPIAEEAGYELRNSLIDLLDASGRRQSPLYTLKITVKEQIQGAALQPDATITRYNYTLIADYALLDARSGGVVTHGQVSSLTAYNVVASPYATQIASHDAQRRAADVLAERIRLDLGVYFANATGVTKRSG